MLEDDEYKALLRSFQTKQIDDLVKNVTISQESYLKDRNLDDYRKLIKALNIRETK